MNRFGLGEPGGADALGEPGQSILIVDDEPRMRASLRRLLARTGREIVESTSGGDAIGALRYGAVEFVRKREELGALPEKVDATLGRLRLQREHRLMTARLGQSERLHRFLVDNSPDLVFALDDKGRFVFLNQRVETMLGYARDELIGRHWLATVHEADRELARQVRSEEL